MGLNTHDPNVSLKITIVTCGSIAVLMTCWRLWLRRGRYWWDDGWALFAMLALLCQFASVFLRGVPEPNNLSQTTKVASYYLMACTFYSVIWTARLSILFSVIRLQPDPTIRKRLFGCAAVMFITYLILLAQLFWTCEPLQKKTNWKNLHNPQCKLPKDIAITQLVTDVLADGILVLAPLQMIRQLANRGLRRRLMFIFSTSIITTIVSLVHAAYIITTGGFKVLLSALIEDSVSLMVANVPVLATAAMRFAGVHVVDEDEVPTTRLTTMRFDPSSKGSRGAVGGTTTNGRGGRSQGFFKSIFSTRQGGSDGSTTLAGTATGTFDDGGDPREGAAAGGGTRTFRLNELRSAIGHDIDGMARGSVDLDLKDPRLSHGGPHEEHRLSVMHISDGGRPSADEEEDARKRPADWEYGGAPRVA